MPRRFKPLPRLEGDQARAADPSAHAALSASAGTGKTQVLTARVLRLLLQGVSPGAILCLTFTKAGAAEMANRIGDRLARWVRLPDNLLRHELFALGEPNDPPALQRARRLFARVLETPGGLRIQTIHAFAQTLLASFPAEAGISPGFQPIEGRAEQELATRTLADLLTVAEQEGEGGLTTDVAALSMRLGEEEAVKYLMRCAHADAIRTLDPVTAEPSLRAAIGLPEGDIAQLLAERCADGSFDCASLHALGQANRLWGTATGVAHGDAIEVFLGQSSGERAAMLDLVAAVVLKADGNPRTPTAGQRKGHPDYDALAAALAGQFAELKTMRSGANLVAVQAAGLRAGAAFAKAYTAAKRAAGVADFDDLITWTRGLFEQPGMGEWVRYKLDRRTDHILVDEAQDSNRDQWLIVEALAAEFFAGTSEPRARTLFMVGDFKQAIYGFQGTDPSEFNRMRETVRTRAQLLVEAEDQADSGGPRLAREYRDLSIDANFRSAPAILEAVDAVIREVGFDRMGLPDRPNPHSAVNAAWPGRVEHWPAFEVEAADDDAEADEGWITDADRAYASRLAAEVKALLDEAPLMSSTGRPLCAGDVMILVRSRKELASLLVARLFSAGVPVAGIDRLHLHKPLAVRDLIAAVRFAVQPLDDLNLAGLLVSPLIGWDQDDLYKLAQPRGDKQPLWRALQQAVREGEPFAADTEAKLGELLRIADYVTPARFLETILSGPLDGRRALLSRLGEAARDPIDELLASALEFERTEIASLDRFLAWFERGDVEIKRDAAAPVNAVRVMTVHGAKGLEAPVVIVADATADPGKMGGSRNFELPVQGGKWPLLRPRKEEMIFPYGEIAADAKAKELEEHWRLLYVAMTRAAERLIIAGAMPRRLADDCWHVRVERALVGLGAGKDDAGKIVHVGSVRGSPVRKTRRSVQISAVPKPTWLHSAAPPEPRPSRPLAPSSMGDASDVSPPPGPAQIAAAKRGTLLHKLFERLPHTPPESRKSAALAWLERTGITQLSEREELAEAALKVLANPLFSDLFDPAALAEAPIAATLPDGRVIAGTVDRLFITENLVKVIDYKTGRSSPAHQVQLAAYRDALSVIFPDRVIEAVLLYTAVPELVPLDG
jgi:ATP-dependent helicase/nuclease subunit A